MPNVARALTVAGSDSGGCAGIQADLKTFAALRVHGMSAIASVTAQNTTRVLGAFNLPPDFVELQISAVAQDIGVDAMKTGMLATAAIIQAVARQIKKHQISKVVVDPVMVSTGGDRLIDPDAEQALAGELFPLALAVTPNLREAQAIAGLEITDAESARTAARLIHRLGPRAVIVKGGHFADDESSVDLFYDGRSFVELTAPRIPTRNTHGSGCTFAAALTAFLARGVDLESSVRQAKDYVTRAIAASFPLGKGHGPLGWVTPAEQPSISKPGDPRQS